MNKRVCVFGFCKYELNNGNYTFLQLKYIFLPIHGSLPRPVVGSNTLMTLLNILDNVKLELKTHHFSDKPTVKASC